MGLLEGIFNNERVLKTAFGMVKKLFTENGIKLVTLELDENGEVLPQLYKDDTPVVVESSKFRKIEEIMQEQAKNLAEYAEENARLRSQINDAAAGHVFVQEVVSAVPEQPEPGPQTFTIPELLNAITDANDTNQ